MRPRRITSRRRPPVWIDGAFLIAKRYLDGAPSNNDFPALAVN